MTRLRPINCVRYAAAATLFGALAAGLIACGPPAATGAGPTAATALPNNDCATQKRQLDAMAQRGQGHSPAYRAALDRYLAQCF